MEQKKIYVEVVLPLPIDQNFTYHLPQKLDYVPQIGTRVLVPFVNKKLTGYVVGYSAFTSVENVKDIDDILDEKPIISTELFRLAKWISEYYICPLGEVLKAMLPSGLNQESNTIVSLVPIDKIGYKQLSKKITPNQSKIYQLLLKEKVLTIEELRKKKIVSNVNISILKLEKLGLLKKELILQSPKAKPKIEKWLRVSENNDPTTDVIALLENRAPKQALCLKLVHKKGEISRQELLKITGVNASTINTLLRKNLIHQFEKEAVRSYYPNLNFQATTKILLNRDQHNAVSEIEKAITNSFFKTFLLYGVTGSGKTQVYVEAIKKVLAKGRTAIVLVPEISLTPQTVNRFTANFPNLVAVIHSRMSVGERYDSWRKLKQGQLKIAIGPRSAIFAPLKNLGLIIVDEEQESSYKQSDTSPLYHARDVAVVRGKLNEAVVILGSATPSIESFYNAKIQKYQLLELPNRIDNVPMPEVKIIDMTKQKKMYPYKDVDIFSKPLQDKIIEKINLKQQIILLQNRRGFSTFIKCKDCGHIENCVNCNITLTFHVTVHRLRCHYCNYIKKAPDVCPKCHSNNLLYQGIGTQRVESSLQKLFPNARLVRMDLDTTAQKRSHDLILHEFEQQKYNILLGTQMVAKGLDFEKVTLVGVVSADTTLLLPDFRASERTFQLLTQVAGRAGRKNLTGEVIIQTYSPNNYGLICAKSHDVIKFFSYEIQQRKNLDYPPFSRLIQILVKGENEQHVITAINEFNETLPDDDSIIQVLGPVAAPLSKIHNFYRWHLILKVNKKRDPASKIVNQLIRKSLNLTKNRMKKESVRIHVNVDPFSLL